MLTMLTACGTNGNDSKEPAVKNDVAVEELFTKVSEKLGENYYPNQRITGSEATELYGLTLDNCEEVIAELPMISTNADLLLIAKAKEGKVEDVKAEIETLRESKVNDTMQYPMNVQKTAASSVEVIGNYVAYVQLGGSAVELETDEEIKAACEEDNKTAITVIQETLQAN